MREVPTALKRAITAKLFTHADELKAKRVSGGEQIEFLCRTHDDVNRPSASWNEDKGTWYCHACKPDGPAAGAYALAKLLGIDTARFDDRTETRYQYRNQNGVVVATKVRTDLPDGSKRCHWEPRGIKQAELWPFNLFEVKRSSVSTVVLVEGEKAAQALIDAKIPAVGTPGASWNPTKEIVQAFTGFNIVLWPDLDDPGYKLMRDLGARLTAMGLDVRVVDWGEMPKDDAFDCIERHGITRTRDLLKAAVPYPGPLGYEPEHIDDAEDQSDRDRVVLRPIRLDEPWPDEPEPTFRLCGPPGLDALLPPIRSGLVTVEGQPGVSKTWMLVNFVLGLAREGYLCAIVAREGEGYLEYRDRLRGNLSQTDWVLSGTHPKERAVEAARTLDAIDAALGGSFGGTPSVSELCQAIDRRILGLPASDVQTIARLVHFERAREPDDVPSILLRAKALQEEHGAKGVVILLDAIQDVAVPEEPRHDRWQCVEFRAGYWEALSNDHGILTIASVQLNRDGLARGSADLEYKACLRLILKQGFDDADTARQKRGFHIAKLEPGEWPFRSAAHWSTNTRDACGLPLLLRPVIVEIDKNRKGFNSGTLFAFAGSIGHYYRPDRVAEESDGFPD